MMLWPLVWRPENVNTLTCRKSLQMLFVLYLDYSVIYADHWSVSGKLIPQGWLKCLGLNKLEWSFSRRRNVASWVCISSVWMSRVSACKLCGLGTWLWVWFLVAPPGLEKCMVHDTGGHDKSKHSLSSWCVHTTPLCGLHALSCLAPKTTLWRRWFLIFSEGGGQMQSSSVYRVIYEKNASSLAAKLASNSVVTDTPWKAFWLR